MGNTGGIDAGEKVSLSIHSRTVKLQGPTYKNLPAWEAKAQLSSTSLVELRDAQSELMPRGQPIAPECLRPARITLKAKIGGFFFAAVGLL